MKKAVESADTPVVWITGAGSGIGRAAAHAAADAGWRVALSGRRAESLASIASEIEAAGGQALIVPLDVADRKAVTAARDVIVESWNRIDAVVLAAGLNSPRRRWDDLEMGTFEAIVATNLLGSASVVDASLPELRRNHGAVVVVSSYSAWSFSSGAGVAYSASKTGLGSLVRTINAQEAHNGIRACHLCPGDVNTEFLRMRPVVPDSHARALMLSPADVARAIQFVLDSPAHVRLDEIVISPVAQV